MKIKSGNTNIFEISLHRETDEETHGEYAISKIEALVHTSEYGQNGQKQLLCHYEGTAKKKGKFLKKLSRENRETTGAFELDLDEFMSERRDLSNSSSNSDIADALIDYTEYKPKSAKSYQEYKDSYCTQQLVETIRSHIQARLRRITSNPFTLLQGDE